MSKTMLLAAAVSAFFLPMTAFARGGNGGHGRHHGGGLHTGQSTAANGGLVTAANPGNPIGAKGSRFATHHPRRNEINKRIANQRSRINQGVASGKLTST